MKARSLISSFLLFIVTLSLTVACFNPAAQIKTTSGDETNSTAEVNAVR